MSDNVLISFLDYKTRILIEYSKVFIQMLVNEHKIVQENRKIYSRYINEFISLYVHNYYFEQEDSHPIMERMVPQTDDSLIKNAMIIASICVECDKLLTSLEKDYNKKDIKKVVEKLVALFNIDLEKIRNKNAFENLALQIQENFRKEKKFMAALNEEDEEFYNLYRYNPVIQNVYFIEYNLDLPEFKKWYPANVKKALNDNEISSAMTMISLQTLSKLILKELVKWNKSDRFILKIDSALLKGTKKFNDLQKMLNNNYLKQAIYLLIDYEDYINYQSRVRELKEMGYRYLIEVLKPDLTNINISPKDTVYIAKDIIENNRESINSLIENGIMVVEKNNMFTYTESEILTKNKEELS